MYNSICFQEPLSSLIFLQHEQTGSRPLRMRSSEIALSFSSRITCLCTLKSAVVHIANTAMDRLKSTFHSSPPIGEEKKPIMVSIDVPIATCQVSRFFGAQSDARTTRIYGTPPATPRGMSESTIKITIERTMQIATALPSDISDCLFFFMHNV